MAEVAIGALASCVVTELIKVVITCTQAAVKCKAECKKLHRELVSIKPDVERIERRLAALREVVPGDAREDLQMVDEWLRRLKDAIETASGDVHRCNSGAFSFDQHRLSVRLKAQYDTITSLAQQRQSLFLNLRNLMPVPAPAHEIIPRPPQNWHESPGASVLRRMAEERNDALQREDLHRQSLAHTASSLQYNSWAYGYSEYESSDGSSHGGYRTDTDSSGHGGDHYTTPGVHLLRQTALQRDDSLQERQQQSEAEKAQRLRRHTLASAYGHDPEPAYDKWKY